MLAILAFPVAPVDGSEHTAPDCEILRLQNGDPLPVGTAPCAGVRPGAWVLTGLGRCSFNFMFRGSDGHRYIGTAGHCLFKDPGEERAWPADKGPPAWDREGNLIGEFAYANWRSAHDFALIRLHPDVEADPAMCHFGGPTGVYRDHEFGPRPIRHVGGGVLIGEVIPARTGTTIDTLHRDHAYYYAASIWGDSGSGVTMADGAALAVHVATSFEPQGIKRGTRIDAQLPLAEAALGIELELLTAPLEQGDVP